MADRCRREGEIIFRVCESSQREGSEEEIILRAQGIATGKENNLSVLRE